MNITAGSTNVSVYYYIVQDASATSPGEPVTGLLFSDIETGGSASYVRAGAARTDLTLVTLASASAAHTDGGFILVDDTNMPGLYRCDYPDAAFAAGVDQVYLSIVVASANNAVAAPILVDMTAMDVGSIAGDATSATNLSKSALGIEPAAAISGTLSTTQMTTDLTEATDDHYNGRIIVFTTGSLANQATDITDYVGSTKLLTFTALTEAPVATDEFVII